MTSQPEPPAEPRLLGLGRVQVLPLLAVGLVSGFFAGLFGIGGGLVIVPALVVLLRIEQKLAAGTSLLAILPAASIAAASYALGGSIDWAVAGLLAIGAIVGAQVGARLLQRIPRRALQWIFVGFVAVMIVQLLFVVPDRGADPAIDLVRGAELIVLGLVAGLLSAILGIGGGGVVVPVLMVWFGMGDLAAKGASLVMMLPGVISGLIANWRLRNVAWRAGLVVGASSLVSSPLGAWVAHLIPAQAGAWLFAAFLVFIGVSMLREAIRLSPAV